MRFLAAIAASLAAHAVLALALAWWLGASGDRELARLDLSSVELSFAEEEDDSAAAAPTPPPAPPSQPERPKELPPPEEKPELEAVEPDAVAFAEPVTEVRPLPENGIEIASQPDWAVGSVQLTNVADVVVAAGATLKSDGAVVLRRLGAEIDSSGNIVKGGGTVDGFAVAPKGVFNLSRMPPEGGVVVPYAFSNMVDIANFRTWSVAVNGTAMSKYRIAVMTAGVCIYPVGTLVIMR